MTTIAWDGDTLAADSLMCSHDCRAQHVTKIKAIGTSLVASVGEAQDGLAFEDWYEHRLEGASYPVFEDGFHAIVVDEQGCWDYGRRNCPIKVECKWAWGSGRDYAIGAMRAGCSAPQAVAVAIECDVYSGGKIHYGRVERAVKAVDNPEVIPSVVSTGEGGIP